MVPASPSAVFEHVARLDAYPAWLGLVHEAVIDDVSSSESSPIHEAADPAWSVELRARVGPVARSKRLRMVRTSHEPPRTVEFQRAETDGREHARWALRVELEPVSDIDGADATRVTMHLAYDGALWTGGLLERVLDEEIRRGRGGLVELVSDARTR